MFFFFILLVFLMGFSVLRTFKNILFGRGDSGKKSGGQRRQTSSNSAQQRSNTSEMEEEAARAAARKKIFTKEEGEYVDYEEVK